MQTTSIKLILIVLLTFIHISVKANEQTISQPVYFLAQIKITDKDKFFNEYAPQVSKLIKANGGKVLFGGTKPQMQLEGSWDYFTIAIEFASKKHFDDFYYSKENLNSALPIRIEATSSNNVMLF